MITNETLGEPPRDTNGLVTPSFSPKPYICLTVTTEQVKKCVYAQTPNFDGPEIRQNKVLRHPEVVFLAQHTKYYQVGQ